MSKLQGEILTLPKMSGSVSAPKSLSGNVGAKIVNIGEDGATFIPNVSAEGVISWSNDKNLPNPEPVNIKGEDGRDGIAGVSPIVSVADIDDGHRVTITDARGANSFDVLDGKDGYTPKKGVDYFDGQDGKDGADGFSPVVSVTDIEGGHRVSITDKDGEKTFDVMDGQGGGGVTSWNDLTDKPFGETLDYSTIIHSSMGKFKFKLLPDGSYSATANVGSISLVVGKNYRVEVSYMRATVYCKFEGVCVNDSGLLSIRDGVNSCGFDVLSDNTTINCIPSIAGFEHAATSPMLFVKIYEGAEDIIPLDEKYIPDTIARTEDILTEEDVTALINNALGVIENGSY